MRKETLLLLLGVLVFISPLLGVPEAWRAGLLFGLGGCIVLVAILYRLDVRRRGRTDTELLHREHDPRAEAPLVTPR
jgi:hypothetical protein